MKIDARQALIDLRQAYIDELSELAKKQSNDAAHNFLQRNKHTALVQYPEAVIRKITK